MGFCSRCGGITQHPRCSCGGSAKPAATSTIFSQDAPRDKWSKRYTRPSVVGTSSSPTRDTFSPLPFVPSTSAASTPTSSQPPPSFGLPSANSAELNVFGSVLSQKDRLHCVSCDSQFSQGAVLYPHPADEHLDQSKKRYFCRECFGVQFPKGTCKKCGLVILATSQLVRSDSDVWHKTCFSCEYCPSTEEPVIDFVGLPACQNCFESAAYLRHGLAPPPHLAPSSRHPPSSAPSKPAFGKTGTFTPAKLVRGPNSQPVATSKSGRTSPHKDSPLDGLEAGRTGLYSSTRLSVKPPVPLFKEERNRSPIAPTLDELGEKLRKAGFIDTPGPTSPTKPASSLPDPPISSASPSAGRRPLPSPPAQISSTPRSTSPTKPVLERVSAWTESHHRTTSLPATATARSTSPSKPSPRPVFAETQPTSTPSPSHPPSSSPTKQASLPPVFPPAADETHNPESLCAQCAGPLGYGEFISVAATGRMMHRECFKCEGCGEELGAGKHVVVEEKCWHRECAPPPPHTFSFRPSIRDTPSSPSSPIEPSTALPPPAASDASLPAPEATCSACARPLGYGQNVTVPKTGKTFHETCFTCARCGVKPAGEAVVEVSGLVYHEKCAPPPASPSPRIRNSPFFAQAQEASPAPTPRRPRPISLPPTSTLPPKHIPPVPLSPSSRPAPTIFARRPGGSSASYGGLLICPGCSTRATEKETIPGPKARRYHRKCLVCRACGCQLDSECRVGEDGELKCEACRRNDGRLRSTGPSASETASPSKLVPTRLY